MDLFPQVGHTPQTPEAPAVASSYDCTEALLSDDETAMLSPMEEWRQRHGVMVYPTQEGFRACDSLRKAHGATREEALLEWARKSNVKCWKAEALEKLSIPV